MHLPMNPIVVDGRVAFFGSRPEELFGHMAGVKHDRVLLHDVAPASRITLRFKIVNAGRHRMARGALVRIDTDASNSKTEFPQRDTVGGLVERERLVPRRIDRFLFYDG